MGGRSRSSSSSTTTTVTQTVYQAPPAPPSQQVITAGNVNSIPALSSFGSTIVASPLPDLPGTVVKYGSQTAWNTVPFVPFIQPSMPFVAPSFSRNIEANADVQAAQNTRDSLCEDILNDPTVGAQDWTITGNGGATRFRFPVRGAPTNVTIVNLSTSAALSTSSYSVQVRGVSFSWLVFDTAPSNGVDYRISFNVGDSGLLRVVRTNSYNRWLTQVREIETRVQRIKESTSGSFSSSKFVGGNAAANWSIGDPTLIGDAEQAVADLKSALGRPGMKMNVGQIAGICDYLNSQLERISNNLSRNDYIGGVRLSTPPSGVYGNADVSIASRIYDNDIRYNYFSGPDACAIYGPPNARANIRICYRKEYDAVSGRYYYTR